MKNKGFTTIELISSFTIAVAILVVLFNVVLMLKDDYEEINSKTELLISKDNLSYTINQNFKNNTISSLTRCDSIDNCFIFTYSDGTSDTLYYDEDNEVITFNNYTFLVASDFEVGDINVIENYDASTSTNYNGHFIVHIPITHNDIDYSIKVPYLFHTDSLSIVI